MTRAQLEHAIRAACEVASDTELYVFGSQAILGEYPEAPGPLRASIEVDVQPVHRVDRVDTIDGVLGELSLLRPRRLDRSRDATARMGEPHDPGG